MLELMSHYVSNTKSNLLLLCSGLVNQFHLLRGWERRIGIKEWLPFAKVF